MLPRAEFDALCDAAGGVELEKDLLLEFLHNIGTVFYRQGLFGDQLILDQAWALNAVYAVFDRERSLHQLRRQGGRFDRALLGALVWDEDEHSLEDQEQFIEFMRTSGMCFELRRASAGFEAEYIAPDLLPEREHPDVQERFTWFDPARVDASGKIAFALLPQGLLRTIMAGVGKQKPDVRRNTGATASTSTTRGHEAKRSSSRPGQPAGPARSAWRPRAGTPKSCSSECSS